VEQLTSFIILRQLDYPPFIFKVVLLYSVDILAQTATALNYNGVTGK